MNKKNEKKQEEVKNTTKSVSLQLHAKRQRRSKSLKP